MTAKTSEFYIIFYIILINFHTQPFIAATKCTANMGNENTGVGRFILIALIMFSCDYRLCTPALYERVLNQWAKA